MCKIITKLVLLTAVPALILTACTTPPRPFTYESDRDLKPGPGLFSGEDGVFKIPRPENPEKQKKTPPP